MLTFLSSVLKAAARELLKPMIIPPTFPHCTSLSRPSPHHHVCFKPLVGFPLLCAPSPNSFPGNSLLTCIFLPNLIFLPLFLSFTIFQSMLAPSIPLQTHLTLSSPKTLCVNFYSWNVFLHTSFLFSRSSGSMSPLQRSLLFPPC